MGWVGEARTGPVHGLHPFRRGLKGREVVVGAVEVEVRAGGPVVLTLEEASRPRLLREGAGSGGGFDELGFHRLELACYGFNERAIKHAERAGFVREGVKRRAYLRHGEWQDAVLFGLVREDLEE